MGNRRKQWTALFILLFLISAALVSIFWIRRPKSIVVSPTISKSSGLPDDFYEKFRQKDETWAKDKLGVSSDTMAASGCLTCCLAGVLNAQGTYGGTPGELNKLFSETNVYNSSGAILWAELEKALPSVTADTGRRLSNEEINNSLASGEYPIVKVRTKSGFYHWVVLMGTDLDKKSFYCLDPLNGKISLNEYGNRIYGIRIVKAE